jgi:hypothetical protein
MSKPLSWGAGVVCGVLLATASSAEAQDNKFKPAAQTKRYDRGRVHQMEVFDGSRRTVRYFGNNISPGDSSTLRELERAENEVAYLNDLQSLKTQYVISERLMETYRRLVQRDLYGKEMTTSNYGTVYTGGGYGFGYPSSGAWNYGYGWGNYGGMSAVGGSSSTTTLGLASGVGYEGSIKDAMAQVLAQQSSPEYVARIERNYDMALLRAGSSPRLRAALKLPTTEEAQKERSKYALVDADVTERDFTMTVRGGEKIQGRRLEEKGDWFVVEKANGTQTRIRQNEVTRIDYTK